ncbi:MAG TPA: VWA domain-containing protein [Phycisphaerae bacterium]|nr:VWA domain-containing protein [Phycisphaerae bacterium]
MKNRTRTPGVGQESCSRKRRAAVVAQVAVGLTTLCGFAALSVDVGIMYYGRAELQRSVDAAALAAAAQLGNNVQGDAVTRARQAAVDFANRNQVLGSRVNLNPDQEVILGRADLNTTTGKYTFQAGGAFPNAISIQATRRAPTVFASVFGLTSTQMAGRATAVLIPRDIALVADLSGSHTDDSELQNYKVTGINLYDVWDALPNNADLSPKTDARGFTSAISMIDNGDGTTTISANLTSDNNGATAALGHVVFGLPQSAYAMAQSTTTTTGTYGAPSTGTDASTGVSGLKFTASGAGLGAGGAVQTNGFSFKVPNSALDGLKMDVGTNTTQGIGKSTYGMSPGPTFGTMSKYGTFSLTASYNPTTDVGLQSLPKQNWSDSNLRNLLLSQGYITAEVNALMSSQRDGTTNNWQGRVAVALGLSEWRSGISGGRWQRLNQPAGNADTTINYSSELNWPVSYPYAQGNWKEYIDYMASSSSAMYSANTNLRYRFGLKTFVNFLLEKKPAQDQTPELANVPQQPMQAVKDASIHLVDVVEGLESDDQIALVGYGNIGYGPADKPNDLSWLTYDFNTLRTKVNGLQGGMWTSYTNIAQGIDKGRVVLFDENHAARGNAAKVMILLTDGNANYTRNNPQYNESQARADTLQAAHDIRGLGVRIYTVSVGVESDKALMQEIAQIGGGEWFHAEGSIDAYAAQLETIFRSLGGKRPVILVE